ncbi:MAG TPA: hypothetical protein VFN57_19965 [Thermomicrobiaceae bacterium]|nr:hypothetical protein [Thermomicrobiaceae bacterium]
MGSAQETYDAIKNLEQQGVVTLPETSGTVVAGTFDAASGGFHYAVPTMQITLAAPPNGGEPPRDAPRGPRQPVHLVAGVVTTDVVDLSLQFELTNPDPGASFVVSTLGHRVTVPAGQTSATLDVGAWTSDPSAVTPNTLEVTLQSGPRPTTVHFVVVRPPTFGAFTIPALPIALVYAPPPGSQGKNYAEYTSLASTSTKISTSFSGGDTTRTATAYSTNDFIAKIGGLVDGIAKLGASLAGSQSQAAATISKWTAAADLVSGIIQGLVPADTSSDSTTLSTSSEHDLVTTDTGSSTFGTPAGLGPGAGDRFVYLRNVRVAWLIAHGQLDFTVLGYDGVRGFAAHQLLADAAAMGPWPNGNREVMAPTTLAATTATVGSAVPARGTTPAATTARFGPNRPTVGPITNLDLPTIESLLALDPYVFSQTPELAGPRFVPNDPPSYGGTGTDPGGDVLSISHDVTTTDINTTTNVTVHITDTKPGWLVALFGDNTAREEQISATYGCGSTTTVDQRVSSSVHYFAAPDDPPYVVGVFFDRLFRTMAFTALPGTALRDAVTG